MSLPPQDAAPPVPPPAAPELVPQPGPSLVFKDGAFAGRRVEVSGQLVLGRENADLVIEDSEVSRRHASVRPVDSQLEISDLGSSNGTFVNGARIQGPRRLEDGDEIRVGKSSLRVVVPPPPRSAATVVSGSS